MTAGARTTGPTETLAPPRGFLAELSTGTRALRGVAILLVVFFHVGKDALPQWFATSDARPFVLLTNFGVDVFVLLSGFGLALSFLRTTATPGARFGWGRWAWRRFARVAPAYWVVLTACVALGVWLGDGERLLVERLRQIDDLNVVLAYLGVHGFYQPYAYRIYGPFWFISLILLCYVLFTVLAGRIRARDAGTVLAVTLAVGLAGFLVRVLGTKLLNPVPFLAVSSFGLGIVLALLATPPANGHGPRIVFRPALRAVVALLGLAWVALVARYRYVYFLYPLLSLALVAFFLPLLEIRWLWPLRRLLERLGDISYELFLVHMPLVTSLRLDRLPDPPVSPELAVALGLVASIVLAVGLQRANDVLLRRTRRLTPHVVPESDQRRGAETQRSQRVEPES